MPAQDVGHEMTSYVNKRHDVTQSLRHSSVFTYIFVHQVNRIYGKQVI